MASFHLLIATIILFISCLSVASTVDDDDRYHSCVQCSSSNSNNCNDDKLTCTGLQCYIVYDSARNVTIAAGCANVSDTEAVEKDHISCYHHQHQNSPMLLLCICDNADKCNNHYPIESNTIMSNASILPTQYEKILSDETKMMMVVSTHHDNNNDEHVTTKATHDESSSSSVVVHMTDDNGASAGAGGAYKVDESYQTKDEDHLTGDGGATSGGTRSSTAIKNSDDSSINANNNTMSELNQHKNGAVTLIQHRCMQILVVLMMIIAAY